MKKQKNEQVTYYHQQSEVIFKEQMPKIAEVVNQLKPHFNKLSLGIKFTSIAKELLKNNFSRIDQEIDKKALGMAGGNEYLKSLVLKDLSPGISDFKNKVQNAITELDRFKYSGTIDPTYNRTTIDNNQCLDPDYLIINEKLDLFEFNDSCVDSVRDNFTLVFSDDEAAFYQTIENIATQLNKTREIANRIGFDLSNFDSLNFLNKEVKNVTNSYLDNINFIYEVDPIGVRFGIDGVSIRNIKSSNI